MPSGEFEAQWNCIVHHRFEIASNVNFRGIFILLSKRHLHMKTLLRGAKEANNIISPLSTIDACNSS